ncbi:MAG: signal peptidase II [Pseudomonadota bacterium]
MRTLTRFIAVAALLVGCVGCDQVTKTAARTHLSDGPTITFLHDTVRLTYAENVGAFLSLGESLPKQARAALFQGGVGLIVLALVGAALFWRGLARFEIAALALLGASGLGNLIDRLLYDGRVTDFLNLGIGQVRTGVFNVADVVGVLGVIVLLVLRSVASPPNKRMQRSGSP